MHGKGFAELGLNKLAAIRITIIKYTVQEDEGFHPKSE